MSVFVTEMKCVYCAVLTGSLIKAVCASSLKVKENIETSVKGSLRLHELKQHKSWFEEEYLYFLEERKQAKLQWAQNPSRKNVDNLNNVSREGSLHFRNKRPI